jgi:lysophospholipid acyltransferase (LPLAT)-like uncharacterized protein
VITDRPRRKSRNELVGRVLAKGLSLLAFSWRVKGIQAARVEIKTRSDGPLLLAFWHGKYFGLLALLRGIGGRVFVADGPRGEIIGEICRTFGSFPVVLPRHQRDASLNRMRAALADPLPCATAFDGPLGPPHRVKESLLELATAVGATILPLSVEARPRLVLRWRWDRREIPWPFARVELRVGKAIKVPRGLSREDQLRWCERVKQSLDALEQRRV